MKGSIEKLLAGAALAALAVASPSALAQLGLRGAPVTKMTKEDFSIAGDAIRKALEDGRDGTSYSWSNPQTGASGSIVPGPGFVRDGLKCRKATFGLVAGGSKGESAWTLCKVPEGWKAVD
jgi:surface antigen